MAALVMEIWALIAESLDIIDLCNLACTNKNMYFILMHNGSIAKTALKRNAPHSLEAREAAKDGSFARGLRRLVKRQMAMATARPFAAACVAMARKWIYNQGMLCYTQGPRNLRLLNLNRSSKLELLIDWHLLLEEFHNLCPTPDQRSSFVPRSYADGILICVYKSEANQANLWLFVLNLWEGIVSFPHQTQFRSPFVALSSKKFAVCAWMRDEGADLPPSWIVAAYSVEEDAWGKNLHLRDLLGDAPGRNVCFQIFGKYLYAVSNYANVPADNANWTSYYYAIRVRLRTQQLGKIVEAPRSTLWRRQNIEGAVVGQHGTLSLERDSVTGKINIVEVRMECPNGKTNVPARTTYTTELVFPATRRSDTSSIDPQARPDQATTAVDPFTPTIPISMASVYDLMPGVPIAQRRKPEYVHESEFQEWRLERYSTRSYETSTATFIDLLRERRFIGDPTSSPYPRIRAISRFPMVLGQYRQTDNTVSFWPSQAYEDTDDQQTKSIFNILNPGRNEHGIRGAADDRSVVYSFRHPTGCGGTCLTPVTFVSFDPATNLPLCKGGGEPAGQNLPALPFDSRSEAVPGNRDGWEASRVYLDGREESTGGDDRAAELEGPDMSGYDSDDEICIWAWWVTADHVRLSQQEPFKGMDFFSS